MAKKYNMDFDIPSIKHINYAKLAIVFVLATAVFYSLLVVIKPALVLKPVLQTTTHPVLNYTLVHYYSMIWGALVALLSLFVN